MLRQKSSGSSSKDTVLISKSSVNHGPNFKCNSLGVWKELKTLESRRETSDLSSFLQHINTSAAMKSC